MSLLFGLVGVVIGGLLGGLVGILFFGFQREQLSKRSMLSPNEGIRRFIKNGLFFGLVFGLVGGLVFGLVGGLASGLVGGLVGGLVFGLSTTVQHYTLRFWLWQARSTPAPWRYVTFLDGAAEQMLLRKVGGGYIFVHRLLLEYFASLDTTPTWVTVISGAKHTLRGREP